MKKIETQTARQRRAANSKFKNADPNARKGNFEVAGLFYGNDMPQRTPFPNLAAALSHFARLSSNNNISVLKLVEYVPVEGSNQPNVKVLHQLMRTNQRYCNSKAEHIWRKPGSATLMTDKAIYNSNVDPSRLEYVRTIYSDGRPWWEARQ